MSISRADIEQELAEAKALAKASRKQKSEADEAGDGDARALALEALERAELAERRARIALAVFDATGERHGVIATGDEVVGTIAVALPPGTSREEREKRIAAALAEPLAQVAASTDAVLAATPARYVAERPGRDAEGRTVLDVRGRVEGGRVVPAVRATSR